MIIRSIILSIFSMVILSGNAQMTIVLDRVPQLTPLLDELYYSGTYNNWNRGDWQTVFEKKDGVYSVTIIAEENSKQEFYVNRGNDETNASKADGSYIDPFVFTYKKGATLHITVEGWRDMPGNHTVTKNVFILSNHFEMDSLKRHRRIWICLPNDYSSGEKTYPVIYMQDGQNLFDQATAFMGEWHIDETMLAMNDTVQQSIIIGIDNGGSTRMEEYSYYPNPKYNFDAQGGNYADFIINNLKPFIDQNFRTQPERESTFIGGSSLGALISAFILIENPEVFSGAMLLSPAFWFNEELFEIAMFHEFNRTYRIYQVASQLEDNGSVVKDMMSFDTYLSSTPNDIIQIKSVTREYGAHSEWFWDKEFGEAYMWLMD